jgi:phenylpropionate dioxygenase-like ring-hydroxylating dioxygenase large terminal subunit
MIPEKLDFFRPGHPDFDQTHRPVEAARHAPAEIYTSAELYQLEKEQIWMRDWLAVGREEEIPNAGDYTALRILDEPVLLVRGKQGEINAFANICQHRGVEICTGTGNKKALNCPFHGWTYDLSGKLIGAPLMRESENFDFDSCRLPTIRCERWKGWIFINFDKEAGPLSRHVAVLEQDFGYLRQEDCALAVKTVCEVDCNWKIVVENFIDFYHVNVVHTTTNGRDFTKEAYKFSPRPRGGYVAEYNSGPSTFSKKPVFGRMPWMEDKPESYSVAGLLAPNFTLFGRVDDVHPYVTWPLSLTRTRVIVYTLLPRIYFDQPDFAEKVEAYREFQQRVLSEDAEMLRSLQNGLASRNFAPGRMASLERGVQHVLNGYLDRMFVDKH